MSELVFCNPFIHDGLILIEKDVLEVIQNYRQDCWCKLEAGGLLLGYRRGAHIHVTDSTRPQSLDVRSKYEFFRKDIKHQEEVDRLWKCSGRKIDYLGEWHTHPEIEPSPSLIDLREWKRICMRRKNALVFIIGSSKGSHSFYCAIKGNVVDLSAQD